MDFLPINRLNGTGGCWTFWTSSGNWTARCRSVRGGGLRRRLLLRSAADRSADSHEKQAQADGNVSSPTTYYRFHVCESPYGAIRRSHMLQARLPLPPHSGVSAASPLHVWVYP